MQKKFKQRVIMVLCGFSFLIAAMIFFVFQTDPCNVYNLKNSHQVCGNRYNNAGRIRHHLYKNSHFDAVSVGSSVSQNFLASDIEKYLGWNKVMRLYIPGYFLNELDTSLKYALESGKIKSVLWGLDVTRYEADDNSSLNQPKDTFPEYLYNNSVWDDFSYLTSYSNIRKFLVSHNEKRIQKNHYPKADANADFDFWADHPSSFQQAFHMNTVELPDFKSPAAWVPEKKEFPLIDKYISSFVKKYPNVEFYLFFPPYPYIGMAFPDYLNVRHSLVDALEDFPNVKIFDFMENEEIAGNIANYRDGGHYQPHINTAILKLMGQNKYRLTQKNIDQHDKNVSHLLSKYKPYSDYEKIIESEPVFYQHEPQIIDNKYGLPVIIRTGRVTYPYAKTLIIKIEADVPRKGRMGIIGQPRNSDGDAVVIPLDKGNNTRYVMMNMLPAEQDLTFSFENGPGKYIIKKIQITAAKEDF